jgi:predicted molibdopterin-dependent oxidoreductase YjgC
VFPLITIDDKITWYGFPVTELFFEEKNNRYLARKSPIFKITGEHANGKIISLCNLEDRLDEKNHKIKIVEKGFNKHNGLAQFIKSTEKCKICGESMELVKNRNGKLSLKCSDCEMNANLTTDILNNYIAKNRNKCRHCGGSVSACIGPYGLYLRCIDGHCTNLSDLV